MHLPRDGCGAAEGSSPERQRAPPGAGLEQETDQRRRTSADVVQPRRTQSLTPVFTVRAIAHLLLARPGLGSPRPDMCALRLTPRASPGARPEGRARCARDAKPFDNVRGAQPCRAAREPRASRPRLPAALPQGRPCPRAPRYSRAPARLAASVEAPSGGPRGGLQRLRRASGCRRGGLQGLQRAVECRGRSAQGLRTAPGWPRGPSQGL